MNLHEYQAKQLFASYGLPVPTGQVAYSVDDAVQIAKQLSDTPWVVKAQVHAGGRGKAGGIKIANSKEEVVALAKSLLGTRLVTQQTGADGQLIDKLLIEEPCTIDRELYLGAVIDRACERIAIIASTEGGVEIETVAHNTPEKIFKILVDPIVGVMPFQCRILGFKLDLTELQIKQFTKIVLGLSKMFVENDCSLVEINPLAITTQDQSLLCLDAKINIDANALCRQSKLKLMRDPTQEDERERKASDWELNYVPLNGNIGCMVNGAGLAMATMDIIKLYGGEPANFLDVGGGATKERVREAFKIILSDQDVKGILINIFGGIVRCDLIAEGILAAVEEIALNLPVVVRLEGNNAELGINMLNKSNLNIIAARNLADAAEKIVKAAV